MSIDVDTSSRRLTATNRRTSANKKTRRRLPENVWKTCFSDATLNSLPAELETERTVCPTCSEPLKYDESGFQICENASCGIIYEDVADMSPEWRYYGADDNQSADPTRCGMPVNPLLKNSNFGCVIYGPRSKNYTMQRIYKYTEWQSTPYNEKILYANFQHIITMSNNEGIPKIIIDQALMYYKKLVECGQSFRGTNKDGLIAASIYIACRANNCPRSVKELADIFCLDATDTTNGCKNAQNIINTLEKNMDMDERTYLCSLHANDFIQRFCSKLNISAELTMLCSFIAMKIDMTQYMAENSPNSIAAGIVYFVAQIFRLNITKTEVFQVSKISEVTIVKCYKKIMLRKQDFIPTEFIQKYQLNMAEEK